MTNEFDETQAAANGQTPGKSSRRRLLKAGPASVPLVMTVKARPVWAQEIEIGSGMGSPWYTGTAKHDDDPVWNSRGDVVLDPEDPNFDPNTDWDPNSSGDDDPLLNPDNIVKFRDPEDKENAVDEFGDKHADKPSGGSSMNAGDDFVDR